MSNTVILTETKLYETAGKSPVTLEVIIGNADIGGTFVAFAGTALEPNPGTNDTWTIGTPGEDMRYKLLVCTTNVKDINPQTNKTSVTYKLSGGAKSQSFPFSIGVRQDGGYAMYSITFAFI